MASPAGAGPAAVRRLRGLRRLCLLTAAVAAVAGCVGMPSNGPAQEFSAGPQSSTQDGNLVGSVPLGPQAGQVPVVVVEGFLTAADSYPLYDVAKQYLTSSAFDRWKPGAAVTVFSKLDTPVQVPGPAPSPSPSAKAKASPAPSPQVKVEVSGTVQATFNGEGQYVSALNLGPASSENYIFDLVKVGGQWRIDNPPNYRMLSVTDFPYFYKAQDLYFMDPRDQVLVPDSVFLPQGLTVAQSLTQLVDSLTVGPKTPWLTFAVDTELPLGASVQQVVNDGSTVTVNLKVPKAAKPTAKQLELFSAQLVWTLIGPSASSSPAAISSVVLEVDGVPWTPPSAPCPDSGRVPDQAQTLAPYSCFDPYPSSPSNFYYVDRGQSWARCGAETLGLVGSIGTILPIVGHTGAFTAQGCAARDGVREASTTLPAAQPASLPAVTMAAVSPDGSELAIVTAAKDDLYVGKMSGLAAPFAAGPPRLSGGITSLSWDRNDNLWVTQGGVIYELPSGGKPVPVQYTGDVTDLSVAPDGVRIAFIVQGPHDTSMLELAAIGGGTPSGGVLGPPAEHQQLKPAAGIGPGVTNPASVAWYNADDLLVVNDAPTGTTLMEVPVDGQQPVPEYTPPGLISITADGRANVLVAGLSGNTLDVSTSLEGPWYSLGQPGQSPAYPG